LADLVVELTGNKSGLIFKDLPQDDPQKRKPDISLAREVLNWEPQKQLKEGLRSTIDYFKSVLSYEK